MNTKLEFKVFDENGKDITDEKDWYVDKDGNLFFETNDVDCPLLEAEGFTYQVILK